MKPASLMNMLLLAAVWGASFLFMRVIAPELGALPTAFFRVAIAATGLLVMLALMRVKWAFNGKLKTIVSSQNLNRSFKLSQDHVKKGLNQQGCIRLMFH